MRTETKIKRMKLIIIALAIAVVAAYMVGFGHGQLSSYSKMHDDKTVQSMYEGEHK